MSQVRDAIIAAAQQYRNYSESNDKCDVESASAGNGHVTVLSTDQSPTTDGDLYVDVSQTQPLLASEDGEVACNVSFEGSADESSTSSPATVYIKETSMIGEESSLRIAIQVFFPYLVAGFGMVGAGAVLEIVKVSFEIHTQTRDNLS